MLGAQSGGQEGQGGAEGQTSEPLLSPYRCLTNTLLTSLQIHPAVVRNNQREPPWSPCHLPHWKIQSKRSLFGTPPSLAGGLVLTSRTPEPGAGLVPSGDCGKPTARPLGTWPTPVWVQQGTHGQGAGGYVRHHLVSNARQSPEDSQYRQPLVSTRRPDPSLDPALPGPGHTPPASTSPCPVSGAPTCPGKPELVSICHILTLDSRK